MPEPINYVTIIILNLLHVLAAKFVKLDKINVRKMVHEHMVQEGKDETGEKYRATHITGKNDIYIGTIRYSTEKRRRTENIATRDNSTKSSLI